MTWRDYTARLAWLDKQEAEPSRSDYYAMQIAMEVRRVLSKHPNRIKLKHFKLRMENGSGKSQVDYKKLAPYSIANWRSVLMGAWKKLSGATTPKPETKPPEPKPPIPQGKRRGDRVRANRK